jgi:hypothetical protein
MASAIACSVPAAAMEPWQIGHGPFVTASDVTKHNRMPLDIADVNAALATEPRDWDAAIARFAYGGNFPNHSLALFTDNYHGRFENHLPDAVAHFGNPNFMHHQLFAALVGSGEYRPMSEDERAAFIEAGLQAVSLNWSRYELGESRRKATMAEPNWSLENGSPKNWNEIFAFYYGPDGEHSTFETMAAIDGGTEINDALIAVLAEGQDILVTETWTDEHAEQVEDHLDRASVLILAAALETSQDADEDAMFLARARTLGAWLAAAEALGADDAVVTAIGGLREAEPKALAEPVAAVSDAIQPHLSAAN